MGDLMDGLTKELTVAGFIVYPHGSNFVMMKVATPLDNRVLGPNHFDSYEQAAEKAQELYIQREFNFSAIVRYNRGLGIEYRNIREFSAFSREEAQKIAQNKAEELLGSDADIREVRVYFC